MKKIYKYRTGAEIPEGAIYLSTVTQTQDIEILSSGSTHITRTNPCWLVWHYFLVEEEE